MERTIRVTGKGKLSVRPDTIRLLLTLEGCEKDYAKALKRSEEMTASLKDCLQAAGFERSDLKTTSFSIDTEYEGYQDKNGNWKQRFKGYRFVHALKTEFPLDNERLGEAFLAISKCQAKPEFHLEYTIKDPEAAKNRLLARAVEDAGLKARVLTEASGVTLGDLVSIDYSFDEISFISRPMNKMRVMSVCEDSADTFSFDLEADDITVTDSVTLVWTIK